MPRRSEGPKLVFRAQHRSTRPVYLIRWYEGGRRVERSTGTDDLKKAQDALAAFLTSRAGKPVGPSDPTQIKIATVLHIYGDEHAPHTAIPADIGRAIEALLPFWGDKPVAFIKGATCRAYVEWRTKQRVKVGIGKDKTKRIDRYVSPQTAGRELDALGAACNYCVREGYLTHCTPVTRPKRGPRRERWLTRQEAAKLLQAARKMKRSRHYLPYVILVALYHGQRKRAVTALQWLPNTTGGHVDLTNRQIDFRPIEKLETKKRRARAPINPRLLTFLRYLRRRTRQYVFEQDVEIIEDGRVRVTRGPIRDVKKAFANAAAAAGLSDVTMHTLVHTCCTWLMQAGVPISEAAGFVNKTEQIFSRTYSHHHPSFMRRAVDALARRSS